LFVLFGTRLLQQCVPLVPGAAFVAICSRPTSVKPTPWRLPRTPSCSGLWSSKSSALSPMRRSCSPSRTKLLRQKLHTALVEASEANSNGAPQLGQAAR